MLFYFIAVAVVLIDQGTKIAIRYHLEINETYSLWGMPLTHIENAGMAGGLLQGYARLFGVLAVLFVAVVLYSRQSGMFKGSLYDIGLSFLVGGALGNGIDRLLFGRVTDFLVSRNGNGVLNMADHAIEIGVALFVIRMAIQWLKERFGRRCPA
ncbi:signal peptidase II [Cohnella suwonensis]|uniref:Lipoprotein signal peptidase n=1 Tax=Cohnella suwonensis TaxID=696072 RepID=A0ABW0LWI9_9BACL